MLQRPLVAGWHKATIVRTHDTVLRQYEKAEFGGGVGLKDVLTERGETTIAIRTSVSEPAGRGSLFPVAVQESSRGVKPVKDIRASPRFAVKNALPEF